VLLATLTGRRRWPVVLGELPRQAQHAGDEMPDTAARAEWSIFCRVQAIVVAFFLRRG
jgi:hypothetical protein